MKTKYNILICFLVIITAFFVFPFAAKADEYKVCSYQKDLFAIESHVYGNLHVVNGKVVFDVYREGSTLLAVIQLTATVQKTCGTVYDSNGEVLSPDRLLSSCPSVVYEARGTGPSTEKAWIDSDRTTSDKTWTYNLTRELSEADVGRVDDKLAYGFSGTSHDVSYTSKISGECPTDVAIFRLLGIAYGYIKIIAPVLMLLFGSIDFAKATAAGDEKEMSKAQKAFSRRLVAAVIVFLVFVVMDFIIGIASNGSEVMECVGSILN